MSISSIESEDVFLEQTNDNLSKKELVSYDDCVSIYMSELDKPILTKEEEIELFTKLKNGNDEERKEIQKILIERNLRLVASIAKKHVGMGLDYLDLIQVGNIALMDAVSAFKLEKERKFSTFATFYINGYIMRYIKNQGRCVRIPVNLYEKIADYKKAQKQLEIELKCNPTLTEISRKLNISIQQATMLYELQQNSISFNNTIGHHGDAELIEFVPSFEDDIEDVVVKKSLSADIKKLFIKAKLTDIEIAILVLRYGLSDEEPMSLQEIGEIFKVSRERIRQKENKALMKLRRSSYIKEMAVYMDSPEQSMENVKSYIKKYYQSKFKS